MVPCRALLAQQAPGFLGKYVKGKNTLTSLSPESSAELGSSFMSMIAEMEEVESLAGKVNPSPVAPEDAPLEFSVRSNAPESPQKPKEISVPGLSNLVFEAKSSKDGAWYDVATFLNHRFLETGELEVRVRFAGYGNEDDEWVNVERAVRECSISLEPSECDRIKVGDLVLCFQDTEDEATYYDAHIVKIQRRLHDSRCCRCIFVVRYDHDEVKEKVQLDALLCRPK